MKIVRLEAENFKRLKAVEIAPGGNIVEITGKNGAGKTSVLDAIWAALGGKDAAPPVPIRKGEEEARISLDLGELKVIRKFRAQENGAFTTSLVVESSEGARFPSPQGVLDALVGSLTFDPLAFQRMDAKGQFATCRAFVPDVDFVKIEQLNRGDFERRTDVNRKIRDLKGELAALPNYPSDLPESVDLAGLEEKLATAGEHNAEIVQRRANRERAEARLAEIDTELARLGGEKADILKRLQDAPALPAPIDTAEVRAQLEEARGVSEMISGARRRRELEERISTEEEAEKALTASMDTRKKEAAEAVAAAKMPIPGLGFGDGLVLLNGVPFEQASDAEQLRASIAIAAAMNPRLKIVRVRDGSLLDADAFTVLEAFAAEHDLQIWIETVASGRSHAVLIENGEVASAPEASAEVGAPSEIL